MDLTKDIIDFTQKVDYSDNIKSTETKILSGEDFGIFSNMEKISKMAQEANALSGSEHNAEKLENKMPTAQLQKPTTPQLIENTAHVTSIKPTMARDISPPPRPLTSSEVVGFITTLEDPEMQLDPAVVLNKSRSLPASPNHLKATHISDLFTFKPEKQREIPLKQTGFLSDKKLSNLIKPNAEALTRNNQQFCLRWNNYQTNLTNVFDELLQNESFVDVTLACEGQSIKAHKMILSACSPYFQALFYDNPCQHPIVIMRDVRWQELKALMEFMYKGEINVSQEQINPLLKVAEMLKIRGLAEVSPNGSGMAAQQLIPEQRMTVFDDEEDEEEVAAAKNDDNEEDKVECSKAKRARIQISAKTTSALDLKLAEQRVRKRSRDGLLIDEDRLRARSLSRSPSPLNREKFAETNTPPPIVMTASTIVRNPFASPNPSNQPAATNASATSTSSSSSSSGSGSATSGSSVSSTPAPATYRSRERSLSPSLMTAHAGTSSLSLASPNSSSTTPQISIHPHPAATAAAAAALANPHHPHHHAAAAAQQFAAQQQLHAAHSHAAMASALGASLAAAAAGAGSASAGPASSAGSSSHHDDMEIKPEIAEMIREEERV
ncbi:protein bric-a-brac 2, partial [Lucilia sericata]|uniref:protein bric-a-brac 2 n=1 Tax=Lucilia sericata TaxID=13632 RepID=UPI0018A867CE